MAAAMLATAAITVSHTAYAQQSYRNISNQRFRAVGNGPQSGIIVDVKDPKDVNGVRQAIDSKVRATMRVHTALLEREIALLRQRHILRPGHELPLVQMVHLRQNGRLVSAGSRRERTRDVPATNELTFSPPTGFNTTDTTSTSYTTWQAINTFMQLQNGQPAVYQELKKILGQPFSTGNVVIRNVDPDDPSKNISVRGVIIEPPTAADPNIYIDFPSFHSSQDVFLGLAQALTQAFYVTGAGGQNSFGFDVYTQGIARAAACIAGQDFTANGFFSALGTIGVIDPVPSFYYTPYYDLLNQPALGNNTFFPPTPSNQTLGGLAGMLVPRLQMASTAWTKCYIEDPQFFIKFNNMYYDAVTADGTVANNAGRLRDIAAAALPNVEGLPFPAWFEQQYIFDTSVTPGPKLFVNAQPTPPDQVADAGASVFLVYYATTTSGDEKGLSGVVNPVYFDYTYANRLVLASGNAQESINNGFGQASPFFTGIGDPSQGQDKQRLAIDFPVSSSQANSATPGGNEYVRVYFPANEESVSNVPTNFSGVVIGALSGYFQVTFNGGSGTLSGGDNGGTPVTGAGINGTGFGAFNGTDTGSVIPTGFHKATINFRPSGTNTSVIFQRNMFTRKDNLTTGIFGVSPVFVLNTGLSQASLTLLKHTFLNGPQMVALPFQPYQPYISNLPLLFSLAPGTPDSNAQLIAQYRQDADPNTGKYVRYPSLPPYQPGYSFWTNFAGVVNNADLSAAGEAADNKDLISVPLQFGWNMIGNPYLTNVVFQNDSTTPGIQIQYLNGDPLTLQEAINAGYVTAGVFGFNSTNGVAAYQDITTSTPGGLPQNTLQPWTGYWLRVLVTEGVTLSYINPSPAPGTGGGRGARIGARSLKRTRASSVPITGPGEWRLPLVVRNASGSATSALLGQSTRGADTFVPALDAASPPPFAQSASLSIRFPHADWDTGKASSGTSDFLSDIRRAGASAKWDIVVNTPQSEQPYVLTWNNTARLPRGLRLTLTDMETGTRQLMNTGISYTFTPTRGVTSRKFQIQAEPRTAGRLFVSNLRVDSHITRGTSSSATISYEVSGASEATVEIHNGSGHVVRRLAAGRATTTGVNQVFWDLKDDQGRALATGTYMVYISVRTPEGEQARSIIAHPITR
jgi:hypothetical protein